MFSCSTAERARTAIRTTVEQCSTIYRNQTCLTTKPRDCSSGLPTRSPGREPAPVQHVNLTEFENLKKELETAKAQTAELVNLKQELETLKAEKATAEKDTKWNA